MIYTHPNQEFIDGLIKEYDANLQNIGISMLDKLYQEVPTDYFESDRFNHTLGIICKWVSYLPSNLDDSFREDCWPVFRDHRNHSMLVFSDHYAAKGEGKLSVWGTPMSKSEWEKDWLFFSGSIWKSKSNSVKSHKVQYPNIRSLSYSFLYLNFTASSLHTAIDTRILNSLNRSSAIEMLGI